jgi:hypothetical protein
MLPLVAPVGTVALICVELLTVKDVAVVPLNLVDVAPVKFVPVIVTEVPITPLGGLKLVMVGGAPPPPLAGLKVATCAVQFPALEVQVAAIAPALVCT